MAVGSELIFVLEGLGFLVDSYNEAEYIRFQFSKYNVRNLIQRHLIGMEILLMLLQTADYWDFQGGRGSHGVLTVINTTV